MHHPTDRITHTTAFVRPVVEHWLEREIAPWVHPMKDRSDDPSHHELTLLPWSYISLLAIQKHLTFLSSLWVSFSLVEVGASSVLPNVSDVCASFQFGVLQHLAKRLQRALLFCELKGLLPPANKTLVWVYFLYEIFPSLLICFKILKKTVI